MPRIISTLSTLLLPPPQRAAPFFLSTLGRLRGRPQDEDDEDVTNSAKKKRKVKTISDKEKALRAAADTHRINFKLMAIVVTAVVDDPDAEELSDDDSKHDADGDVAKMYCRGAAGEEEG